MRQGRCTFPPEPLPCAASIGRGSRASIVPQRATKPANLRSETPAGVVQELYALSLVHFVVRAPMFESASPVEIDPDRLSLTGCFQILRCRLPECNARSEHTFQEWYEALLWKMSRERTEPRHNRTNPRVIKQKMSK